MLKLALLKLIVSWLVTLGIFLPAPFVWICNPGHQPGSAPSNCERVHMLHATR